MQEKLINYLCCPLDRQALKLDAQEKAEDGHIMTGSLTCSHCGTRYVIDQGVPNMLPEETALVAGKNLGQLQASTILRFGFEWRYFQDWGWLETYPDIPQAEEKFYGGLIEHTQAAFWAKSLFRQEELKPEMLVLDAGCGNGRFTNQVALTGAEVIGIDLGWGVYSAFLHTKHLPNVHIVRGDLFRLPFADSTFDRIFSIGVLMHTGNACAAFNSLARTLRPGGLIVAHVYGQGKRSYEIIDALIRSVTVYLPIKMQIGFAQGMAVISRWLRSGGERRTKLYWRLFSHINLLPTKIHMFDWWSAPIATHHTKSELLGWFRDNGLTVLRTNPPDDGESEAIRRQHHAAITVLGQRPS